MKLIGCKMNTDPIKIEIDYYQNTMIFEKTEIYNKKMALDGCKIETDT